MLENLLDTAASTFDEQERMRLIRQMVHSPEEIIPIAYKALHQPPPTRQEVAIEIFREIGYPANALVIPDLVIYLGDPNRLGWDAAVQTLVDMGPDVVVPHILFALLDQSNVNDVDGLCLMLTEVESEFARRCCPAVTYLLSQEHLMEHIEFDYLLRVVEKAGTTQTYVLPALLELQKHTKRDDIKDSIQQILTAFSSDAVAPYALFANC